MNMRTRPTTWPGRDRCRAFTVVELMVAVSILTVIVLILYRLFDQTQRAMRSNASQVDVLEGGRAAMEMLVREVEQIQALADWTVRSNVVVGLPEPSMPLQPKGTNLFHVLDLPGEGAEKRHFIDSFYFLTPFTLSSNNQAWTATCYRVLTRDNRTPTAAVADYRTNLALQGVGWLAKWTTNVVNTPATWVDPWRVGGGTDPQSLSAYQRVTDGVVHFRVTPLDSFGKPLYLRPSLTYYTNVVESVNQALRAQQVNDRVYAFTNSAVPAFVDIELGIMEPQAVDRWRALPPNARERFLTQQSARVHYFQQRVPVRKAPRLIPIQPQP